MSSLRIPTTAHADNSQSSVNAPSFSPKISVLSSLNEINSTELGKIIKKSPRKTCSLDPLPSSLIHRHLTALLPVFVILVNGALKHGLTTQLKFSLVTPLLKKPHLCSETLSNYRPVANLAFLAKTVERIVVTQLMRHLEFNKLLDPFQYAYRRFHSCETALLQTTTTIFRNMDTKKVTLVVLLDLSSAFDLVEHNTLLNILREVGVAGNAHEWFVNYLSGRYMAVSINETRSVPCAINCGVPQGSVLGPILFALYLHGINEVFQLHGVSYCIYADDIQLSVSSSVDDLHDTAARLVRCIEDTEIWLNRRGLILNKLKTECVIFGSAPLLAKCNIAYLHLKDHDVKLADSARYLGVTLDSTLSLHKHISNISRTAFGYLRGIAKQKRALDPCSLKVLLYSLVLSRIEFASSAIFTGITKSELSRLQAVSNSALRLLAGLKKFDHISEARTKFHWLSFQQRLLIRISSLIYSVIRSGAPAFLAGCLQFSTNGRTTRSTDQQLLSVLSSTTRMGEKAFIVFGPRVWNSLPLDIRGAQNINVFRRKLLDYVTSDNFCVTNFF